MVTSIGQEDEFTNLEKPAAGSIVAGARLLDIRTVADRLAVCTRTVERLVAKGELASPVKVAKASRWFPSDVEEYVEKLRQRRSVQGNAVRIGGVQ